MSVSAAKSRVMQCRNAIEDAERGRSTDFESIYSAGLKFLDGVPEDEAAPVRKQFEELKIQFNKIPNPEHVRMVSAAKRQLDRAEMYFNDKTYDMVEPTLTTGEKYMIDVPDDMKSSLVALIALFRQRVEDSKPKPKEVTPPITASTPPPVPARPVPVSFERAGGATINSSAYSTSSPSSTVTSVPPPSSSTSTVPLSDDENSKFSRAKGRVSQARNRAESGDSSSIDSLCDEATILLGELPKNGAGVAQLYADIVVIRQTGKSIREKDNFRRFQSEIDRKLGMAENDVQQGRFESVERYLYDAKKRLDDDEVKSSLPDEQMAKNQARIIDIRQKMKAEQKHVALSRANPLLEELESYIKTDPFKGAEQYNLYKISSHVNSLKLRIRSQLKNIIESNGENDPDVIRIEEAVVNVEQKVSQGESSWESSTRVAEVTRSWDNVKKDGIQDWADESYTDRSLLQEPHLPKTREALQRSGRFLHDTSMLSIKEQEKDNSTVQNAFKEANDMFESAASKLNSEYDNLLASAEKIELPTDQYIRSKPDNITRSIESIFVDTKYLEPLQTRSKQLSSRWKSEQEKIIKDREILLEKLSNEAIINWPAVAAKTNAVKFDSLTSKAGDTVLIEGKRNRIGWDWNGREYGFATSVDGVVLAGIMSDNVEQAIQHACYELKIGVSDRNSWDLVGVILGPGKIGERTQKIVRDSSNREVGKVEEWPNIDCVRIKIIALRAGPVCIGPQ